VADAGRVTARAVGAGIRPECGSVLVEFLADQTAAFGLEIAVTSLTLGATGARFEDGFGRRTRQNRTGLLGADQSAGGALAADARIFRIRRRLSFRQLFAVESAICAREK
jgi:hypothetical protein